jgi:hypothetical protein
MIPHRRGPIRREEPVEMEASLLELHQASTLGSREEH